MKTLLCHVAYLYMEYSTSIEATIYFNILMDSLINDVTNHLSNAITMHILNMFSGLLAHCVIVNILE